uniref:Cleavage/polyadenylation specificity factor A subunit C-terminal domain-containing protein n=1 Tax=Plectus sambesii TaxID=2011161 RepID=A0A914VZR8_9BILA
MFGTLDGALGTLVPLSEKVYRRLHMLQSCLGTHSPHVGGLNPRGARISRLPRNSSLGLTQQSSRNIVDGDVVWEFVYLSAPEKLEIAKRLGTTKQQLMDDLIELERVSTHF